MTRRELKILADGFSYLEGPRWHDGRLWLSDFYTQRVIAVALDGTVEDIAIVAEQPSGLGWLPDGRLLIVSMKDRKILRQELDGSLVEHADLAPYATGHGNDMVVDATGNAYVGNFGFDLMSGEPFRSSSLVKVDPNGNVQVVAEDLKFPNGSVITPDGKTLIVDETFGNRISAFDIGEDGSLGVRRDWANWGPLPDTTDIGTLLSAVKVGPDGNTLDADGCVWIADAIGGRAVRVKEGGEIVDEISTGDDSVFAVALGGDDGKTLFLCLAPDFDETKRSAAREARIGYVTVDIPHAGRP